MDNVASPSRRYIFGPSRPIAVLLGVAALALAVGAVLSSDRAGRLLLGCGVVALLAIAVTDLVFWPRLVADDTGLTIFTPSLRAHLAWDQVDIIRVDEHQHRGLTSRGLEFEAGERLIVLSRRALGRDPREVFDQVRSLRPD